MIAPEFIAHIRKDADGNIIAYQSNYVAKGSKQYNEQAGLLIDNQWLEETSETVTSCHTLKMLAEDGGMQLTDVATTEQLFRIIQSESQIQSRQKRKSNFRRPL